MTWRRFTVLIAGLVATETLLNARFRPPPDQDNTTHPQLPMTGD